MGRRNVSRWIRGGKYLDAVSVGIGNLLNSARHRYLSSIHLINTVALRNQAVQARVDVSIQIASVEGIISKCTGRTGWNVFVIARKVRMMVKQIEVRRIIDRHHFVL